MPYRHDLVEVSAPTIDQNGYLVADAYPTKTGVFAYRRPDGSIRRELRHEDDVFDSASLQSLANRPIVDEHPDTPMHSGNTRFLARGHVGETIERVGEHVKATLVVTDKELIGKMQGKGKRQLSCGYSADVVDGEGVHNGQPYDCRQTNIRYNHLAAVWKGRAGPTAQIHLDADDAVIEDLHAPDSDIDNKQDHDNPAGDSTMTIKRKLVAVTHGDFRQDSIELTYDEDSATVVDQLVTRLDESNAAVALIQDKYDASEKGKKKAEGERDQLADDAKKKDGDHAKLDAMADERAELKGVAAHMGVKNYSDMSNAEIKRAVVAVKNPKLKLDDLSDENVDGRFGMICDGIREENKNLESLAALKAMTAPRSDGDIDPENSEQTPRQKMHADMADMQGKTEAEVKAAWAAN